MFTPSTSHLGVYAVNMSRSTPSGRPYHHGRLAEALLDAAVARARVGGPEAVVLRELARDVGVSANAAYRHFADLAAIRKALAGRARGEMARWMQAELDRVAPDGDAGERALRRTLAIGRGYVRFAAGEPGLFRAAFDHVPGMPEPPADDEHSPWGLLLQGLGELESAGRLVGTREDAAAFAWAAVHGLAELLLGGALTPGEDARGAAADRVVDVQLAYIGRALSRTPGSLG
jgi:AcrR family transcriptional regulator